MRKNNLYPLFEVLIQTLGLGLTDPDREDDHDQEDEWYQSASLALSLCKRDLYAVIYGYLLWLLSDPKLGALHFVRYEKKSVRQAIQLLQQRSEVTAQWTSVVVDLQIAHEKITQLAKAKLSAGTTFKELIELRIDKVLCRYCYKVAETLLNMSLVENAFDDYAFEACYEWQFESLVEVVHLALPDYSVQRAKLLELLQAQD